MHCHQAMNSNYYTQWAGTKKYVQAVSHVQRLMAIHHFRATFLLGYEVYVLSGGVFSRRIRQGSLVMVPSIIITVWLCGLLSLGLIGGGAALVWNWYRNAWVYQPALDQTIFAPQIGLNWPTAMLACGIILLIWALAGGLLLRLSALIFHNTPPENGDPKHRRDGQVQHIERPDGTVLQVESYGPEDAPALILTHGWGTSSTEWYYLKRQLSAHFRLIVWDLPGTGRSTRPSNGDYSLEAFAGHLDAVQRFVGKPALLIGHSIGGMTILTFCRLFPEALGERVRGLGLVHTTYINPVRTARLAGLFTALERPLIVPLLYLTIGLSPLVLLMNWLGYLNGTLHMANQLTGFAGGESWGQVEFVTLYTLYLSPAVLAKGMLGMLRYDGRPAFPHISIPTLIIPSDRDPLCTPEASAYMHQQIRSSQLTPLASAKHMGLLEHNQRFAELVHSFAVGVFQAEQPLKEKAVNT
jgi:pimeloyl-ACP methyl ester carboxylesterase